jgi:nucleotide-binding universal stress UspA family protein
MCILVGLDGSEQSFRALRFALEEGKLRGIKVVAIHSLFGGTKTDEEDVQRGEEILESARTIAKEEYGIDIETHLLVRGKHPGEDIVEFANEIGAKLIVVGMKKRSPVEEIILGSAAKYVVAKATQPVVLVK